MTKNRSLRYLLSFKVRNISDVDGVITCVADNQTIEELRDVYKNAIPPDLDASLKVQDYVIAAGACKAVKFIMYVWEIRTSIGGSVLVSNERQIYSEEPRGVNSISHQKYLELCADERIRFGSCNTVTVMYIFLRYSG